MTNAQLIERDDAVIDQLLDLALVLRAFRAANSPDATGGPAFSDPDELAKYLADATA